MGWQREPNPGEAARNAQPYYIDPDADGWKADARAEQQREALLRSALEDIEDGASAVLNGVFVARHTDGWCVGIEGIQRSLDAAVLAHGRALAFTDTYGTKARAAEAAQEAQESDAPVFKADVEAIDGEVVVRLSRDSAELLWHLINPFRAHGGHEGFLHARAVADALGREVRHMDKRAGK